MRFAKTFIAAASLAVSTQALALSLEAVEIGGTACLAPSGSHQIKHIEGGEDRIIIPLGMYLKKEEDLRLARGSCHFVVPVLAAPGKKVIVSASQQLVSLRAYPSATKVQTHLEVFAAGKEGQTQSLVAESRAVAERVTERLTREGVLTETPCGGAINLRGNSSAVIAGNGKGRAFTRDLILTIQEVNCK